MAYPSYIPSPNARICARYIISGRFFGFCACRFCGATYVRYLPNALNTAHNRIPHQSKTLAHIRRDVSPFSDLSSEDRRSMSAHPGRQLVRRPLMIFRHRVNSEFPAGILLTSRIYLKIGYVLGCRYANCEPMTPYQNDDPSNLRVGREFLRFNTDGVISRTDPMFYLGG